MDYFCFVVWLRGYKQQSNIRTFYVIMMTQQIHSLNHKNTTAPKNQYSQVSEKYSVFLSYIIAYLESIALVYTCHDKTTSFTHENFDMFSSFFTKD